MLLTIKEVVAGYLKGVDVLQGINISVGEREIVCLIGPNGAGKSTVLRVVSGLLHPRRGSVVFDGDDISQLRADLVLRRGIVHVPQGHSSFPAMTVHENLLMGVYSMRDREERQLRLERVLEMFPLLRDRAKAKAGNLSGGQQKMLEIGRALMMSPKMIMLDEPSLGLAPKMSQQVFETIQRLRAELEVTVFMVEQNAKRGLGISDRGYVLELGRERLEGAASTLLDDPRVAQLYLGGSTLGAPAPPPGGAPA